MRSRHSSYHSLPYPTKRAQFVEGLELFNQQKMTLAREAFGKAVASDPEFATARGYLARSMNYTGNVDEQ